MGKQVGFPLLLHQRFCRTRKCVALPVPLLQERRRLVLNKYIIMRCQQLRNSELLISRWSYFGVKESVRFKISQTKAIQSQGVIKSTNGEFIVIVSLSQQACLSGSNCEEHVIFNAVDFLSALDSLLRLYPQHTVFPLLPFTAPLPAIPIWQTPPLGIFLEQHRSPQASGRLC